MSQQEIAVSRPTPDPFFLSGGPVGLLLIHGLTGSPPEMRLIGDYAHRRGCTVLAPLLPGHGTTVEDANRQRWPDWVACVDAALADLEGRCEQVFVGGLSLGSLLTLYLAAHHPRVAGAIPYSPALRIGDPRIYLAPVLKYVIRRFPKGGSGPVDPELASRIWCYDDWPVAALHEVIKLGRHVRRALPRIQCPALIVYSTCDRDIHPHAAQSTYDHIGSTDKELVALHDCGHCITVDAEWETVAEKTCQFIADHG